MSYAALMDNIRVKAPGSVDDAIHIELFNVIDELHRTETLPISAPAGSAPTGWLSSAEYVEYQQLLLDGVLARLLGQFGKPYAQPELAGVHLQRYVAEGQRRRADKAAIESTTTAALSPDARFMQAILQQLPSARYSEVETVLFNVIEEMVFTDLPISKPVKGSPPASWLTAEQWDDFSTILNAGVLGYMYLQAGKPFAQPELGSAQIQRYKDLLWRARQDLVTSSATGDVVEELLDDLRMALPGARDGTIKRQLWQTIDEFCRTTNAYRHFIEVQLVEAVTIYNLVVSGAEILIVYQAAHSALSVQGSVYDNGQIALRASPTANDVSEKLVVEVSLAPLYGESGDATAWLPRHLYDRHRGTIYEGVLSRMMLQIAKPYSNSVLGQYHGRRFRNGMAVARARVIADSEVSPQKWRFPKFGS